MNTGKQILSSFFDALDVEYIFGNPGTTETAILEAVSNCDNVEYILSLHESVAVGMAAGYALETANVGVVNIHTYPGLANSMCNIYNAYVSGVPLFITAGQQTQDSLIHNPVLSGDLIKLAETATKHQSEVSNVDDLHLALHRGFNQALMYPQAPTFLSIPMNIMQESAKLTKVKNTQVLDNSAPSNLDILKGKIKATSKKEMVIIADFEVGSANAQLELEQLANILEVDVYTAPFFVRKCIAADSYYYKGTLPALGNEMKDVLSKYSTAIILGEKVSTFLSMKERPLSVLDNIFQISKSSKSLSYDYPCDIAIQADIKKTLEILVNELKSLDTISLKKRKQETVNFEQFENRALAEKLDLVLSNIDKETTIVTEGSSFDAVVQNLALSRHFSNVHFSPRGGGLGWAMPLATGVSLASKKHSVCFVGDGGSQYAIHSIWSAAKYNIPVIYVCVANKEYRILKNLWKMQDGKSESKMSFIGMDLDDPNIDLESVASGFGAKTFVIKNNIDIQAIISQAFKFNGPSFIILEN